MKATHFYFSGGPNGDIHVPGFTREMAAKTFRKWRNTEKNGKKVYSVNRQGVGFYLITYNNPPETMKRLGTHQTTIRITK